MPQTMLQPNFNRPSIFIIKRLAGLRPACGHQKGLFVPRCFRLSTRLVFAGLPRMKASSRVLSECAAAHGIDSPRSITPIASEKPSIL